MAAVLAVSGEAAPATAQALPMGAAFGCLGRDAGTAVQLAWHPFRSKENVQVWEKVSRMVCGSATMSLLLASSGKAQNLTGGGRM